MLSAVYLVLFFLFLYLFRTVLHKSNYKWPPGPMQLPFIGSIISVVWADCRNPAQAFVKFSKKYGPIFSLKLGTVNTVVVSSHKLLSEVQSSDKLLSRIDTDDVWLLEKSDQLPLGILFGLPEYGMKTRWMVQKMFREFGFHSSYHTELIVLEEIVEFCDSLKRCMTNGQICLKMKDQFLPVFYNTIWNLLTRKKCTSDDTRFQQNAIKDVLSFVNSGAISGSLGILFPKLVKMFPNVTGYSKYQAFCETWRQNTRDAVAHHRRNTNSAAPDNFLDSFLEKVEVTGTPTNPLDSIYTEQNLIATVQDLIAGGTDTQASFMNFFIRYLLQNPQIQEELYAEVDLVFGNSNPVNVDDIIKLTRTQAFIYEVLRHASIVPISPRKLLDDWEVNGYRIPKGTFVAINLYGISRDEEVWEDAETFNPKRFLSPENKIINTDKIFAFGFGKRRCIGESLAKTNLMLIIATLVQQFSFHVDPAYGPPSDEVVVGLGREAAPYHVVIKARQH